MKERSYRLKCPKEGRDVTLFFRDNGVGLKCSELRHNFVRHKGKLEAAYYTCEIGANECPYKEILYVLLKKVEPESYLKED